MAVRIATAGLLFSGAVADLQGGASLWAQWVTGSSRLSVWTNQEQIDDETAHPPSDPAKVHPFALETRWSVTDFLEGSPAGWEWVLMEMGDTPMCGPDACYMVLFGLETVNGSDVQLRSFDTTSPAVKTLVEALHSSGDVPALDYSALELHPLQILYRFGYNESQGQTLFYGEGEGKEPDGGFMRVRESVASSFVAPLEQYYDSEGVLQTSYDTPVVYKLHNDTYPAGASLWAKWVTAGSRLSVWTNQEQIDDEAKHPPADPSKAHPFALETRWAASDLVAASPAGWEWVLMEMGDVPFCGPDDCYMVLFGLETVDGKDVQLRSYGTTGEDVKSLVRALHAESSALPALQFSELELHPLQIRYNYSYNETQRQILFFGEGEGKEEDGGSMRVAESVAATYVAPLEQYYDAEGVLQTTYDTPVVYKLHNDTFRQAVAHV